MTWTFIEGLGLFRKIHTLSAMMGGRLNVETLSGSVSALADAPNLSDLRRVLT